MPVSARVLMTQPEALAAAFPKAAPTRKTAFLGAEQVKEAARMAQAKVESRIWTYYEGAGPDGKRRSAYFETHVVRTMPETFIAVVNEDATLDYIELLSFEEPDDYLPSGRWLKQFRAKRLADGLLVGRALRNMTGASLTSNALAEGARRVLAVHRVIHEAAAR